MCNMGGLQAVLQLKDAKGTSKGCTLPTPRLCMLCWQEGLLGTGESSVTATLGHSLSHSMKAYLTTALQNHCAMMT